MYIVIGILLFVLAGLILFIVLDKDEDITVAVVREIKEELGIDLDINDTHVFADYTHFIENYPIVGSNKKENKLMKETLGDIKESILNIPNWYNTNIFLEIVNKIDSVINEKKGM